MVSPAGMFGGNSDGTVRLEEWLDVMCRGCKNDRGRGPSGGMGGMSCPLPGNAYADPDADIPEWSETAERPARLTELGPGPWPVCTSHQPRKRRSDAGKSRAARDMPTLF